MADNDMTKWKGVHQPFELSYHQRNNFRWSDKGWNDQWRMVFADFMEFTEYTFKDSDILVDIGCGSRPCLDWFVHGEKHFIDPLLTDFMKIPAVSKHWEGKKNIYAMPAEQRLNNLVGKCDYVNCWNTLDHTYNWRDVLCNVIDYTRPGGQCLIGTDLGRSEYIGHPGIKDSAEFYSVVTDAFIVVKKESRFVHRDVALKLIRK